MTYPYAGAVTFFGHIFANSAKSVAAGAVGGLALDHWKSKQAEKTRRHLEEITSLQTMAQRKLASFEIMDIKPESETEGSDLRRRVSK